MNANLYAVARPMPSNMSQTRQQDLGSKPFPQVEKKAVDVARIHNPQDPSHAQAQLHHARERPRARSKQIAQAARRKQSRRQGDDARLRNDSRKTGHEIILLWYENEEAGTGKTGLANNLVECCWNGERANR